MNEPVGMPVPVWETVAQAYRFIGANLTQLLLFLVQLAVAFWIPAILISAVFPFVFANVLTTVWGTVAVAPFAVSIHRAILLGEPLEAGKYVASFQDPRIKTFILIGLGIYAVPLALSTLSTLLIGTSPMLAGVLSIAYLGVSIYIIGFMFAFPAIAIDKFTNLRAARAFMRGSILRVLGALFLAILPVFVLAFVLLRPTGDPERVSPLYYLFGLAVAPLFPAVLSYAYSARRSHESAAGPPGEGDATNTGYGDG